MESFNYCVLGAEARTRWSIVGKGAKSSQTQDVFRTIVNDTIVVNDPTVLISNMRKSIQATNVVLNLAVVPNVILMPSNFIILSDKIAGYNNILTTATNEMQFGVNKDVNYTEPKKSKPKSNVSTNGNSHINGGGWGGGGSFVDRNPYGGDSSGGSNASNGRFSKQHESATKPHGPQLPLASLLAVSAMTGLRLSKLF